jgi:type IV pilus biogenesis protein CpaD/CtpE
VAHRRDLIDEGRAFPAGSSICTRYVGQGHQKMKTDGRESSTADFGNEIAYKAMDIFCPSRSDTSENEAHNLPALNFYCSTSKKIK